LNFQANAEVLRRLRLLRMTVLVVFPQPVKPAATKSCPPAAFCLLPTAYCPKLTFCASPPQTRLESCIQWRARVCYRKVENRKKKSQYRTLS
jgi:hypothetical protein